MFVHSNGHANNNRHRIDKPDLLKTRFTVPFKPKERREYLEDRYWTIFGSGSIGSKAEELRDKTSAIEQSGFTLYPRAVLAMGFFDSFRIRCWVDEAAKQGASPEKLQSLVLRTEFNQKEMRILECISNYWMLTPLAVRSSAHGDSRGTGIYESVIITNNGNAEDNLACLAMAVKRVLASEFTRNAIAYRKDLSLPSGMAVMIEPIFGNERTDTCEFSGEKENIFGPDYGGIAYASPKPGGTKAFIAAGLPIRAVNGETIEIRSDSEDSIFSLEGLFDSLTNESSNEQLRQYNILRAGEYVHLDYSGYGGEACITSHKTGANGRIVMEPFRKWLFTKLKALGERLGTQHYLEFAAIGECTGVKVAILQIAKVNEKEDFHQIAESGKTLMRATSEVAGTGSKECKEIVLVSNQEDIFQVSRYNRTHADYAVLYSGRLVSKTHSLEYYHVNNASVFIEIPVMRHRHAIESHWGGALDTANKLFFAAEKIDWDQLETHKTKTGSGLVVYTIAVKVTASEKQQKAIVEKLE